MTLNFSEIKQEKKNYLIQHGIEVFDDSRNNSALVAKHGRLYSVTIELKLMANGVIHYVLKPTAEFSKAFQQYTENTTEFNVIDSIGSVARHIEAIHKRYDELKNGEKTCDNCKHENLLADEEPCLCCYNNCYFEPKESNKTEAKVTNMRDVRIKKVIFNKPYTIVLWKDGSKTMIKCGENDVYDKEKGLALCISKKVYGNKYGWYDIFQKYVPELEEVKKNVKE